MADRVVERDAHAADGAMTRRADKIGRGGAFGEVLFKSFVVVDAEDDVHERTRGLFDRAAIEAVAVFDGVIEQLGFGFVTFLNAGKSAFGSDPFRDEAKNVNGERRRRVVERLFLDESAVLKNGREDFYRRVRRDPCGQ